MSERRPYFVAGDLLSTTLSGVGSSVIVAWVVPRGLESLRRVLRPGGELHMFEHRGSRWFPFSLMLHLMTPVSRCFGPALNRDTPANVVRAGFEDARVDNVFLDVVRTIHASAPSNGR